MDPSPSKSNRNEAGGGLKALALPTSGRMDGRTTAADPFSPIIQGKGKANVTTCAVYTYYCIRKTVSRSTFAKPMDVKKKNLSQLFPLSSLFWIPPQY